MPFIVIGIAGLAAIGGAIAAGNAAGTAAGQGVGNALTIVGIAAGVGIILYSMNKK